MKNLTAEEIELLLEALSRKIQDEHLSHDAILAEFRGRDDVIMQKNPAIRYEKLYDKLKDAIR